MSTALYWTASGQLHCCHGVILYGDSCARCERGEFEAPAIITVSPPCALFATPPSARIQAQFGGRQGGKTLASLPDQVRAALRGCGDRSTDPHELAAVRELTEAVTPEGAALLRRFLR